VVSGIIGFAYSSLTAAYTGTNPDNDDPKTDNVRVQLIRYVGSRADCVFNLGALHELDR
jgi:hypothetical protein